MTAAVTNFKENNIITPNSILDAARSAANAAITEVNDGYPCGFAWVIIKPARGAFVKYLKENGIGRSGTYGGWMLYASEFCSYHGQSMYVKEEAARAFAEVLRSNNITATPYRFTLIDVTVDL